VVLEINTLPGLTDRSLLPLAAAEQGLSFPELCLELLALALERGT
jgi:D-alanine-D-alanine ligase